MTTSHRQPSRQRRRTFLRSSLAAAACLLAGCGALAVEEQLLWRFFEASRLYDQAAAGKVATVVFNPVSDGIVQDFRVTNVQDGGDRRVADVEVQVRRRGSVSDERLMVTFERRGGRWLITGVTRPRASQTSPEASSAPPN